MERVKVSCEVAEALDKLHRDEWLDQFNLIGHCKNYSGNGIRCGSTFHEEFEPLNNLEPLFFAKCLILGYEVEEENKSGEKVLE